MIKELLIILVSSSLISNVVLSRSLTVSVPWCIQEDQYRSGNGNRSYLRYYPVLRSDRIDLSVHFNTA